MINISKYISTLISNATRKALPVQDFTAVVSWSQIGTCDLTCPSAIKLYNMHKNKWNFPSSKEIAQEIVTQIEKNDVINSIDIVSQVTVTHSVPTTNTAEEAKNVNKKEEVKGLKKEENPKEEKIKSTDEETKKDDKKQANNMEKDTKGKTAKKNDKDKEKAAPVQGYFMNITLNEKYIENLSMKLLREGLNISQNFEKRKVLVDFSSPNIAKEMHVGHLRSTIIGDSICRILEYIGHDVMRVNHVGDWGTQFGMLIAYLEEKYPNFLNEIPDIKDLESFYVSAKKKFEEEDFKKKAHQNTVKLQTGDVFCRKAWEIICEISRKEFNKVYDVLNIKLKEVGESFYDQRCRDIIPVLEKLGIVIVDQGAKIIRIEGFKQPMMIVKTDGGLTYDTTDLAAISYRINELNRDWIIYVIASEQDAHLKLLFEAAKMCGWHKPPLTRCDHMGFGLVLNENGKKIATSDGGSVKLIDLLNEGKKRAKDEIEKRYKEHNVENYDLEELDRTSTKIGHSAIKYYDLRQNRKSSYKFDYNLQLNPTGNTAVYLFYAYARICSIYRKENLSKEHIEKLIFSAEIKISSNYERVLLVNLLKFNDVIEDLLEDLSLNKLTDYLYDVTVKFTEFYQNCNILNNENTNSRLLIIELTKRFMKLCFDLLGLEPVEKI